MTSVEIHERDKKYITVDCIFDLNEDPRNMFPLLEKLAKNSGIIITSDDVSCYIYLPEEDNGINGNVGNHVKVSVKFSDAYTSMYFACKAWFVLKGLSLI